LILTGLYRSAVAIAEDVKLRRLIRETTQKEVDFLYDIGSAESSREIEHKVTTIMKKHRDSLAQESGIEPSLTDKEIQDFVNVMEKERKL
jgi:hypothetical protein